VRSQTADGRWRGRNASKMGDAAEASQERAASGGGPVKEKKNVGPCIWPIRMEIARGQEFIYVRLLG